VSGWGCRVGGNGVGCWRVVGWGIDLSQERVSAFFGGCPVGRGLSGEGLRVRGEEGGGGAPRVLCCAVLCCAHICIWLSGACLGFCCIEGFFNRNGWLSVLSWLLFSCRPLFVHRRSTCFATTCGCSSNYMSKALPGNSSSCP